MCGRIEYSCALYTLDYTVYTFKRSPVHYYRMMSHVAKIDI